MVGCAAAPAAWGQGAAVAWGANGEGRLGVGPVPTNQPTPVPVLGGLGSGVTAVSAGGHSLAIQGGAVFAWGGNSESQIGDGAGLTRDTPFAVGSGMDSGVTAVSAGGFQSLALKGGAVFAWGGNQFGQLGDGTFVNRSTPAVVGGLPAGVARVAAGGRASYALSGAGAVFAWGDNQFGQLGDGTVTDRTAPVAAGGGLDAGVTAVSGGAFYGLAVKGGAALAWGDNRAGQLGDGTTANRRTPVAVGGGLDAGVVAVSAGFSHSLAVKAGAVFAWGDNAAGQLGDGTTTDRLTPAAVAGLPADVVDVAAGDRGSSYALTASGRLFAWGENGFGQLGDGTTTDRLTPVEVFAPTGFFFSALDGGDIHALAILTPVPEPAGVLAAGGMLLAAAARLRRAG